MNKEIAPSAINLRDMDETHTRALRAYAAAQRGNAERVCGAFTAISTVR